MKLVRFAGNHLPLEPLLENGRMAGIRFQRTRTNNGKCSVNVEPTPP